MSALRAVLLATVAVSVAGVVAPAPAQAHPFGEPQTTWISADGPLVTMRWTAPPDDLLMLGAVAGAFPERREYVFDTSPDAEPEPVGPTDADLLTSSPEVAAYLADHLAVRQDGVACEPSVSLDELMEDGALVVFECRQQVDEVEIEVTVLTDAHDAYRTAAIGTGGSDPDRWLYTADDPVRTWSFGAAGDDGDGGSGGMEQQLVQVFDGATVVPLALLVAVGVGAAHGLAPGHGKVMAGAYLVGAYARRRHAMALAVIVAGMHTVSVLALGVFWWLTVGDGPVPIDAVTTWGQLAVAVVVLAVGVVIFRRRWRERARVDDHHHRHHHGPPPGTAPWSWSGLAGIASVGGLLPSPSAFLVLVGGLLTGRVGLALGMVAMFGVGLAVTVLAAGLLTVAGRDWLDRRAHRYPRLGRAFGHVPLLAAGAVLLGGCLLSGIAVTRLLV